MDCLKAQHKDTFVNMDKNTFKNQYFSGNNYFIDGDIGMEINGGHVMRFLSQFHDDEVEFTIFSGGGSLLDAIAIYDYVKRHNITGKAYIYGFAASAATIIAGAFGSENTYITSNSMYLMHYAYGGQSESGLVKANKRVVEIYKEITGKTTREIKALLKRGTDENYFLDANEVIQLGLARKASMKQIAAHFNTKFEISDINNKTKMSDEKNVQTRVIELSLEDRLKGKVEVDMNEIEAALNTQLTESKEETKALIAQVGDLEASLKEKEETTSKALEEFKAKFDASAEEIKNKANEIKAHEMTIEDLSTKLKDQDELINKLKNEVAEPITSDGDTVQDPEGPSTVSTTTREMSPEEVRYEMIRKKHLDSINK